MIKKLLQEGFALKNKGHYKHAIEVFYKALEEDNNSTELFLEIGDLYYKMGNEEKALSYIEQILNKEPSHIPALKLLENIFIDKNALEEAEQTAKNIYCFSESQNDLGEILYLLNLQGKYDEVIEYQTSCKNDLIKKELAKAYYYKKEFDKAEELLQSIQNKTNEILILLGKVLFAQKKKDECITILDQFKDEDFNPEILNFKGLLAEYQENYKQAKAYFLEAIRLDSKNDEYYFNLANFFYRLGDVAYARRYYNLAISIQPNNRTYHFALANLYYSAKHYKRALEELQDDFFEGNLLKAIILYDTGYLALATKELNELAKDHPNDEIIIDYQNRIKSDLGLN